MSTDADFELYRGLNDFLFPDNTNTFGYSLPFIRNLAKLFYKSKLDSSKTG